MAYHDGIGKLIQRLEMTNDAKHLPSRYSASSAAPVADDDDAGLLPLPPLPGRVVLVHVVPASPAAVRRVVRPAVCWRRTRRDRLRLLPPSPASASACDVPPGGRGRRHRTNGAAAAAIVAMVATSDLKAKQILASYSLVE